MPKSTRSSALGRRSFVERLGLGAGAFLLGPMTAGIVSEARGQAPRRKRAVFCLLGAGIHWDWNFAPSDLRPLGLNTTILPGRKDFAWPAMVASLEKYRSRTLLVDGLFNVPKSGTRGHSAGYSALSCFAAANGGNNDGGAPPGNITIDQYLGDALGATSWRKTVLFGASTTLEAQKVHTFASGPMKPEAQFQSPRALYADLFGPLAVDEKGVARGAIRNKTLFDLVRTDLKRLSGALAAPERRALDHYLLAIEDFEKRQKAVSAVACNSPAAPMLDAAMGTVEDRLDAMNEMAILALICGLTSVVGIAIGCGNAHSYYPTFKRTGKGTIWESKGGVPETGHEPRDVHGPASDLVHSYNCSLLARMADALSMVKEGDKTMFDNSVMLYTSDNGEQHHAGHERWPFVMLGDGGGKLRADGRFMRFPKKGDKAGRSMADLFCSLATACDVPTDSFGRGGNETVKGPIEALMA
jgi:hypothetical protein